MPAPPQKTKISVPVHQELCRSQLRSGPFCTGLCQTLSKVSGPLCQAGTAQTETLCPKELTSQTGKREKERLVSPILQTGTGGLEKLRGTFAEA